MKLTKSQLKEIIKEEINSILTEQIETVDDYMIELEKTIKKHFPKSHVSVKYTTNRIIIRFAVGNKNEWPNGIFENDPVSDIIFISVGLEKDGSLNDNQYLEKQKYAGSFVIKPKEGSHLAYDRVKVPIRPTEGSPDKIIKAIDAYYGKLKQSIKSNLDKLSDEHSWVKKYV
jgi:hypothetical protein